MAATETLGFYEIEEMSEEARNQANNPRYFRPYVFKPAVFISFPKGTTSKLQSEGEDGPEHEDLLERARQAGLDGVYQVRRAAGGPGRIWRSTKMNIRNGSKDTRRTGFYVVIDRIEV